MLRFTCMMCHTCRSTPCNIDYRCFFSNVKWSLPRQVLPLRVHKQVLYSQKLIVGDYKILLRYVPSFAVPCSGALAVNDLRIWNGKRIAHLDTKRLENLCCRIFTRFTHTPFFFTWHLTSGWSMTSHMATQLSCGPRRLSRQPLLCGL